MRDPMIANLDEMFAALKRDEAAAMPVVSDALLTRILADAADVAAEREMPVVVQPSVAPRRALFGLFSWPSGAVAAMVLGLVFGLSLGYGYGDQAIAVVQATPADFLAADPDFFLPEGPF